MKFGRKGCVDIALEFFRVDVGQLVHSPDYVIPAYFCSLRIVNWIDGRWSFRECSKHRVLRDFKFIEIFAVIDACCGTEPISPVPQKYLVQIEFQNFIFGQVLLQTQCEQCLPGFSEISAFRRQVEISGNLHGDGACTLGPASRNDIGIHGTQNTAIVDANMPIIPVVLSCKNCCNQGRRSVFNLDGDASLITELADQQAIIGINSQWHLELQGFDRFNIRQAGQQQKHCYDTRSQHSHEQVGKRGQGVIEHTSLSGSIM